MGRKTYDQLAEFGEYPYEGRRAFVFSRTPRPPDTYVTFVCRDIAAVVSDLKSRQGKKIWLVGGGQIVAECVRQDLIDEFIISIHPIILGAGIPLFPFGLPERPLQLSGVESFDSGLVQVSYRRAR